MEGQIRARVTSRLDHPARPPSPIKNRPGSPTKTLSPPPIIRPKAKVNSSASIALRKTGTVSAPGSSVKVNAVSNTPRAPSPFKPASTRIGTDSPLAPAFKAKVPGVSRAHSVISGNSSDSRPRAFTSANGVNLPVPAVQTRRRGSISSTLTAPAGRGHQSSPSASKISIPSEPSSPNGKGVVRVKSKVSRLAESLPGHSASLPPSPSLSARRPPHGLSAPNIKFTPPLSSPTPNVSSSSPSSPTILHHRFATTRETHTPKHVAQPFASNDDQAVSYASYTSPPAKVDPAAIPLPPQSPPVSTISFSSRSSASRSSVSYGSDARHSDGTSSTAPTLHSRVNSKTNGYRHERLAISPPMRSNLDGLGIRIEPSTPGGAGDVSSSVDSFDSDRAEERNERDICDEEDSDWERKAEAKSIRKIADLEITNRSLLTINSSLEAAKHKQAKEIRDLRRKLRESRLLLPPVAFQAVKSSLVEDDTAEDEEDDEEDEEEQAVVEGKTDETYRRVRSLLETLLEEGRKALETKPEDLAGGGKGGTKVLHEIEARTWRGEDIDSHSLLSRDEEDTHLDMDHQLSRPLTPSRIAVPDNDDGLGSEDEVEASLLEPDMDDIPSAAAIPPITVTRST